MNLVEIPAGSFLMGAVPHDKFGNATEMPRRQIVIAEPFLLSRDLVTVGEWRAYEPQHDPWDKGELPVVNVSYLDVLGYLEWLGDSWRLPREEEWEYACRAGSGGIFTNGDELEPKEANFLFTESIERVGPGHRTPVGAYSPNRWGINDLHGNVCEWTSSVWKTNLETETPEVPGRRTIRGGAWDYLPRLLRCSWRDGIDETARRDNLGFRVARDG